MDYFKLLNTNRNPNLSDPKIIVNNSFHGTDNYHKNSLLRTFRNVLNAADIQDISDYFIKFKKYPVNLTGIPDVTNQVVGSYRASVYNVVLAQFLTDKLTKYFKKNCVEGWDIQDRTLHEHSFVNHNRHNLNIESKYELLGVSPLFRYMEYNAGSQGHVPHYDAPYEYSKNVLTLMTGILYLSSSDTGSTYILPKDGQQTDKPMLERNTEDWKEHYPDLVQCTHVLPEKGKILLFDHQLAHGVAPFTPTNESDKRIMIRFDLVYKRIEN